MVQSVTVQSTLPLADRPALPGLRALLDRFEQPAACAHRRPVSTGCSALDRLLPGGGLVAGSLIEWLAEGPGSGVSLLPLAAVRAVQAAGGRAVVIDRHERFYPPAAAAVGIDLQNLLVVRPTHEADELWAIDQAVRCAEVAVVLAWPERLDGFTFRRLQLAAESSGAIGLFVRPARARHEPTWATARLCVAPQPPLQPSSPAATTSPASWRLHVRVLRSRGTYADRHLELEYDEQTAEIRQSHPGRLAPQLADPAADVQTA